MNSTLTPKDVESIQQKNAKNRYQYFLEEVLKNQQIWLLIDEYGSVMLNSEDEDCVPVWPNEEFALAWATEEWSHCTASPISLEQWHKLWTPGLEEDELLLVIFPTQHCEGLISYVYDFDAELKKQAKIQP
ncbi:hypothetical protein PCNPT3_02175 [Psychromonas sp. CNPT3]|uniref:DUF2750 domain-containing protein n=1 Tax=Psychromonas sp. CNPT3 TaxID=314282 RepID=UPI00006EA027|nr:DUF2750 domain-containing protein [Psychromonas sp. CNPT3]AGH80377.1 hypothetical protein PCNPT3_02175 [Psychromonas sp. CNPT3]